MHSKRYCYAVCTSWTTQRGLVCLHLELMFAVFIVNEHSVGNVYYVSLKTEYILECPY